MEEKKSNTVSSNPEMGKSQNTQTDKNECQEHKGELVLSCLDCYDVICIDCIKKDHCGHRISDISTILYPCRKDAEEWVSTLKSNSKEIQNQIQTLETDILPDVRKLANLNLEKLQKIKEKITHIFEQERVTENAKNEKAKEVENSLKDMKKMHQLCQSVVQNIERILIEKNDVTFFKRYRSLKKKCGEIGNFTKYRGGIQLKSLDEERFVGEIIRKLQTEFNMRSQVGEQEDIASSTDIVQNQDGIKEELKLNYAGAIQSNDAQTENLIHSCGNTVNKSNIFCPCCGEKMKESLVGSDGKMEKKEHVKEKNIHSCGKAVTTGDKFCPSCGEEIEKNIKKTVEKMEGNIAGTVSHSGQTPKTIEELERLLNDWKSQTLKFGTVGKSAMGKSTFINTILGKTPKDKDFAQTGCGNTTMKPTKYVHKDANNFTIWDTPGFGTLKMTKDMFLQIVDLKSFDFIFIFIDTVITENDLWVAERLTQLRIPFCLVRSKLDVYIKHVQGPNKEKLDTNEIEELRNEIRSDMETTTILRNASLFLISNKMKYVQYGDWTKLLQYISKKIPNVKAELLYFFLPIFTPDVIEIKYEYLRNRIKYVAAGTGTIAAIPVPFIGIPMNVKLVAREVEMYREVLGLNSDFAKQLAPSSPREKSMFDRVKAGLAMISSSGVPAGTAIAGVIMSELDFFIPVIGSAISLVTVNRIVTYYLYKTLDETKQEALNLFQKATT